MHTDFCQLFVIDCLQYAFQSYTGSKRDQFISFKTMNSSYGVLRIDVSVILKEYSSFVLILIFNLLSLFVVSY